LNDQPVGATTTTTYVQGAETPTTTLDAWLLSGSSWSESNVSTLFSDRSFNFVTYSIVVSDSAGTLRYLFLDGDSHNLAPTWRARAMGRTGRRLSPSTLPAMPSRPRFPG
jgi:hypothetical protein